jgi:hypothetical protein
LFFCDLFHILSGLWFLDDGANKKSQNLLQRTINVDIINPVVNEFKRLQAVDASGTQREVRLRV